MLNKTLLTAILISASITTANAAIIDDSATANAGASVTNSNADATTYDSNDAKLSHRNKNLANYQDPYLTNSTSLSKQSIWRGCVQAPKPNVFYDANGPIYNVHEAQRIEREEMEPSSGYYIERIER